MKHLLRVREWCRFTNPARILYLKITDSNVMSISSKIIERVVNKRLSDFMDINKLFYSRQFEFRSKLSPIQALSDITEMIGDKSILIFFVNCSTYRELSIQQTTSIACSNVELMVSEGAAWIGSHHI